MSNVYKALLGLLPASPLQVGTVTEFADGVATLELLGGGVLLVRGVAEIGDQVFFRDGVIEGLAPALTLEVIEI